MYWIVSAVFVFSAKFYLLEDYQSPLPHVKDLPNRVDEYSPYDILIVYIGRRIIVSISIIAVFTGVGASTVGGGDYKPEKPELRTRSPIQGFDSCSIWQDHTYGGGGS